MHSVVSTVRVGRRTPALHIKLVQNYLLVYLSVGIYTRSTLVGIRFLRAAEFRTDDISCKYIYTELLLAIRKKNFNRKPIGRNIILFERFCVLCSFDTRRTFGEVISFRPPKPQPSRVRIHSLTQTGIYTHTLLMI